MEILSNQDALNYWRGKGIRISDGDALALQDRYHDYAFTISGVQRLDVLEETRRSLDTALSQGLSFDQWKKEYLGAVKSRGGKDRRRLSRINRQRKLKGKPPIKRDPIGALPAISPARQRLVFRNATASAHSAGRWAAAQRSKASHPYLQYDAINDSRTRPRHRALDNLIRKVDDPIWQPIFPPNGHNCRCTVIALSREDLKEFGLKPTPKRAAEKLLAKHPPDKGWAHNPGEGWRARAADHYGERLERMSRSARSLPRLRAAARSQAKAWDNLMAVGGMAAEVQRDWENFVKFSAAAHNQAGRQVTSRIAGALDETAQQVLLRGIVRLEDGDLKDLLRQDKSGITERLPQIISDPPDAVAVGKKIVAWKVENQWLVMAAFGRQTHYWIFDRSLPKKISLKGKRTRQVIYAIKEVVWE